MHKIILKFKNKKNSFSSGRTSGESLPPSVQDPDSVSVRETVSLFGPELFPTQAVQGAEVIMHQCSECRKVFGTTDALNKHLLTHQPDRPHVCTICQRGFKRYDHLTGHMLTHQKRDAYPCPQPDCQKRYYGQHSLRGHCSTQHGFYLLPVASQSLAPDPIRPGRAAWEPTQPSAVTEGPFEFHSRFLSPPTLASRPGAYSSHGGGHSGFASVATNSGSGCYPEEPKPSRPDPPEIVEAWGSAVAGASLNPESAADLPTSRGASWSHLWTASHDQQPGSRLGDPTTPESPRAKAQNIHGWESSLHFSMEDLQAWKEALSVQPCEEMTGAGLKRASGPASPVPSKHSRPILLKHQQHISYGNGAALCSGSHRNPSSAAPPSGHGETVRPPLHLPPASKTRKKGMRKKKSVNDADIPVPPLPAPRPLMQKCPRPRSGCLVSPSQVAMASFNRESTSSPSAKTEEEQNVLSRKCRRPSLLSTLIVPHPSPPPAGGQGCRAAGGYLSQLRSPGYLADHLLTSGFHLPTYTPPPMLSPLRPGTGLYFRTLTKHQPFLPPPPDGKDGISLRTDNRIMNTEPRINVGGHFQAEIPPLRNPLLMLYDEHPAQLVCAPWRDLPNNPDMQHRVTEFLDLCCSSVLPGGGTNIELALHCLYEVQGDILAALDLLLVRGDYRTSSHPLSDYHYAGSHRWSAQEMRLFRKALFNHSKDFQLIHSVLQTKSVAQCVEYYYSMKKMRKFKPRTRGADQNKGTVELSVGIFTQARCTNALCTHSDNLVASYQKCFCVAFMSFRGFRKVKSRNAHMKTHRHQERVSSSLNSWLSGDHSQGQGEDRPQVS
uniref:Zinc finger protein 541-like n=1 Tax=Electrophorus electricus TaxID=8005 RepID=A0A4W4ECZ9_ELEEL